MSEAIDGWYLVELKGHRTLAGHVIERIVGPVVMLQVTVPATADDDEWIQIFNPGSVYAMTPITEDDARRLNDRFQPRSPAAAIKQRLLPPPDDDDEREADDIPY